MKSPIYPKTFPYHFLFTTIICFHLFLFPGPADAFRFQNGALTGSLDTTLSYGALWRVGNRDPALVGRINGGTGYSVNGDDGNLNYNKGLISNAVKGTSELDLNYGDFGIFVRGTYFYDFFNMAKDELTSTAKKHVGWDTDLLDAFFSAGFNAGGMALDIRVGNQVVSWGESTFIVNSINAINPVDLSKFRVPGAELREGLMPVPMIWSSLEINENLSIEGFYQFIFQETEIDPMGSYFSTNDFVSPGATTVVAGGTGALDCRTPGICAKRAKGRFARDTGQFGAALRYLSSELNNTEFGLYHIRYHSRVPVVSLIAATRPGVPATAKYFAEYPEDIKLYGISFNTVLGGTGISLQGEYSLRRDMPLQIDDKEIFSSALNSRFSQLGAALPGREVSGYKLFDVSQFQMTLTYIAGYQPLLRADQLSFTAEAGATQIHGFPSRKKLRFEGPGTVFPGNALVAGFTGVPQQVEGFAEAFSWGYRLLAKLKYESLFIGINVSPRLAFSHDVDGTSPGPGGNFIEGRKALTLGLGGDYLNTWSCDISYTTYFGAGNYNLIHDRDFMGFSVKYSF